MSDLFFLRTDQFGQMGCEGSIDVLPRSGMGMGKVACNRAAISIQLNLITSLVFARQVKEIYIPA